MNLKLRLATAGISLVSTLFAPPAMAHGHGGVRFFFRAPDGYIFEILPAERVTGQRQPKPSSSTDLSCASFEKRKFNLSLRDRFLVWQQMQAENERVVLPITQAALGVWSAFIVYRIFWTIRRPAPQGAHLK